MTRPSGFDEFKDGLVIRDILPPEPRDWKPPKTFPKVLLKKGVKLDWVTPAPVFLKLDNEFGFKLDAATCRHNPLYTEFFYTKKDNGLEKPWIDPTFVNPPYGRDSITKWLQKAEFEQTRDVTSVFLLPARTGTKWFHRFCYNKGDVWVKFLPGRLLFMTCFECYPKMRKQTKANTAPFDSMVVVFFKKRYGLKKGVVVEGRYLGFRQ